MVENLCQTLRDFYMYVVVIFYLFIFYAVIYLYFKMYLYMSFMSCLPLMHVSRTQDVQRCGQS